MSSCFLSSQSILDSVSISISFPLTLHGLNPRMSLKKKGRQWSIRNLKVHKSRLVCLSCLGVGKSHKSCDPVIFFWFQNTIAMDSAIHEWTEFLAIRITPQCRLVHLYQGWRYGWNSFFLLVLYYSWCNLHMHSCCNDMFILVFIGSSLFLLQLHAHMFPRSIRRKALVVSTNRNFETF